MNTVIVDSNALLMAFKTSINLDAELQRLLGSYEIVVPEAILGELRALAEKNHDAKSALKLGETKTIIRTNAVGDMAVIEAAEKTGGIILTNDKELIEHARDMKIRVIRLMGRNHLAFADGIGPR